MRKIVGYICVAEIDKDLVFFGKGDENEKFCNFRYNDLAVIDNLHDALVVKNLITQKRGFTKIRIGFMELIIAEKEKDIEYLGKMKDERYIVIAKTAYGYDFVGSWINSSASWSLQGGNSLRENGMQPFNNFDKAMECLMQTCRQQDGEELSYLALYDFRFID